MENGAGTILTLLSTEDETAWEIRIVSQGGPISFNEVLTELEIYINDYYEDVAAVEDGTAILH